MSYEHADVVAILTDVMAISRGDLGLDDLGHVFDRVERLDETGTLIVHVCVALAGVVGILSGLYTQDAQDQEGLLGFVLEDQLGNAVDPDAVPDLAPFIGAVRVVIAMANHEYDSARALVLAAGQNVDSAAALLAGLMRLYGAVSVAGAVHNN